MIVFAIIATLCVAAGSFGVLFANGMRSSPGDFVGGYVLTAAWSIVAIFWISWWVG